MTTMHSSQDEIQWVQSLTSTSTSTSTTTTASTASEKGKERVSIFSWNILAQYLFDGIRHSEYTHVAPDAPVSWEDRWPRIWRELCAWNADVLCLQEVEATTEILEGYLIPAMRDAGYEGVVQDRSSSNNKNNNTTQAKFGVATFWKTSRFALRHVAHRSRSMLTTLEYRCVENDNDDDDDEPIALGVINCHLQGAPDASITRVRQLQHTLHELRTKFSHQHLVVCGDMNCPLSSSACTSYLLSDGTQKILDDTYEWGRRVSFPTTKYVPHHGYSLRSTYPIDLAKKNPADYVTFVLGPGEAQTGIDQIWVHQPQQEGSNVKVVGLKRPFSSVEKGEQIMSTGLPSDVNPSDHLSIGCVLEWTNKDSWEDLCKRRTYGEARTQKTEETISSEEMVSRAIELINKCSFEGEDRTDIEDIITPVPGLIKKTKPTKDQIEQLKNKRLKKQALLSKLSDDDRPILEKAFKFLRDADKLGDNDK